MGEIADMMVDGTLCASCGTFIDRNEKCYVYGQAHPYPARKSEWGIPRHCIDCGPIDPAFAEDDANIVPRCNVCGREAPKGSTLCKEHSQNQHDHEHNPNRGVRPQRRRTQR